MSEYRTADRRAKRQLLEAIISKHNQKDNPVTRETQIVIITRTFRVLENIWRSCGPRAVLEAVRAIDNRRVFHMDHIEKDTP